MANILDARMQNIKAYNSDGEFIGYVQKVYGVRGVINCYMVDWACQFTKKKAQSVLRSANSATIYIAPDKKKYYRMKENFTFKMVDVNN